MKKDSGKRSKTTSGSSQKQEPKAPLWNDVWLRRVEPTDRTGCMLVCERRPSLS